MKIVQRQQGVVFLFQRGNTIVLGLGGIFRSVPLFLGFTELLLQINDLLLTGLDLLNSGDGILQLSSGPMGTEGSMIWGIWSMM